MWVVLDDKVRFCVYSGISAPQRVFTHILYTLHISVYPAHIPYMRWVYGYTRIDTKPDFVIKHDEHFVHILT